MEIDSFNGEFTGPDDDSTVIRQGCKQANFKQALGGTVNLDQLMRGVFTYDDTAAGGARVGYVLDDSLDRRLVESQLSKQLHGNDG